MLPQALVDYRGPLTSNFEPYDGDARYRLETLEHKSATAWADLKLVRISVDEGTHVHLLPVGKTRCMSVRVETRHEQQLQRGDCDVRFFLRALVVFPFFTFRRAFAGFVFFRKRMVPRHDAAPHLQM